MKHSRAISVSTEDPVNTVVGPKSVGRREGGVLDRHHQDGIQGRSTTTHEASVTRRRERVGELRIRKWDGDGSEESGSRERCGGIYIHVH